MQEVKGAPDGTPALSIVGEDNTAPALKIDPQGDGNALEVNDGASVLFGVDHLGVPLASVVTTSATAGNHGDVPAQVVGYLTIKVGATSYKVPYYNV